MAATTLQASSVPYSHALAKVDRALDAHDWTKAKSGCDDLLRMTLDHRLAARNVPLFLAATLTRKALAESAASDADAASWDYHAAAIFDDASARAVAAKWPGITLPPLRKYLPKLTEEAPKGMMRLADGSFVPFGDNPHTKKVSDAVLSRFSSASRKQVVDLQLVIRTDGRVAEPVLSPSVSHCDAFRELAVLETARYMTFDPATDATGRPVSTILHFVFNLGTPPSR